MGKKNKKRRRYDDTLRPTNPLLVKQSAYLKSLSENERNNFFSNTLLDPERRGEIWMEQAEIGAESVNQYAWATPDDRALRILRHFGPIVEVGCGANAYWLKIMIQSGIDAIGYDMRPDEGGKIHKEESHHKSVSGAPKVRKGGPEVLASDEMSKRTLFLCYADEDEMGQSADGDHATLGSACLEHYKGKYVVHVGELYSETLSMDQAPWGRSSGPEFQQRLAAEFHCLLKAKLTSWLHVRDTISVWKRTETCTIVFAAEDENDEDEEVEYRHILLEERLPTDLAAPCLAHLLDAGSTKASTEPPEPPKIHENAETKESSKKEEHPLQQDLDDDQQQETAVTTTEEKDSKKPNNKAKKRRRTSEEVDQDDISGDLPSSNTTTTKTRNETKKDTTKREKDAMKAESNDESIQEPPIVAMAQAKGSKRSKKAKKRTKKSKEPGEEKMLNLSESNEYVCPW